MCVFSIISRLQESYKVRKTKISTTQTAESNLQLNKTVAPIFNKGWSFTSYVDWKVFDEAVRRYQPHSIDRISAP